MTEDFDTATKYPERSDLYDIKQCFDYKNR